MTAQRKPKQAAAVVLLRPAGPKGFEVFLVRRSHAVPFLGSRYGFPRSEVRQEDCSAAMLRRCRGLSPNDARRLLGAHLTPREALGFWAAAIRELFEETGVLLVVDEFNRLLPMAREAPPWTAEKRMALLGHSMSFQALLESRGLFCDANRLVYFSRWQAPPQFATRFDTRFFLAVLPQGQPSLFDSPRSLWLTPDHALRLFEREQLPMVFPTFASLRTLADFDTLDSVLKEFSGDYSSVDKKPGHTILGR